MIDAVSNATVGAGMIHEDSPERQRQEEQELASVDVARNRVGAQERYRRHGYFPGLFLLEDRPALASRLERALFEKGFEILHLNDDDAAPYALPDAIRVAQKMGAVSIYSGQAIDPETKQQLALQLEPRLVDFSGKDENTSDEELFQHAMAFADSLRFAGSQNKPEEGN